MKHALTVTVGLILAAVLLVYMFLFTVRYDEVAVVTTFNRASEAGAATQPVEGGLAANPAAGSVITEPGLYFRWPWPIQEIHPYSKRLQIMEDQLVEQQTADGSNLIIQTYVVWKIDDPLAFFRQLKTVDRARERLQAMLASTRSVISQYRFDQLVNTDPQQLKLQEIEEKMLQQMRQQVSQVNYGLAIEKVGIPRMVLPQDVTEQVFARMKAARERLAGRARAEGTAQAEAIKSVADSAAKRILAFAEERALQLRAEGDAQAAQYYGVFNEDQDLAAYIRRIQTLKTVLPGATIVLPSDQIAPGGGLIQGSDASPAPAHVQRSDD